MQRKTFLKTIVATSAAMWGLSTALAQANPLEVPFYYPVAVGGPITKVIDGYATDFNKAHPQYKVTIRGQKMFMYFSYGMLFRGGLQRSGSD